MKRIGTVNVLIGVSFVLALGVIANKSRANEPRPNILFVIVDDLGPFDLSCTGSELLKTSNIDRIANEGMQFTRAYSGGTVCAPARSTLLTGKHMGHTTVRGNLGGIPLKADDVTVAEVLKKAGYACGGYGKWGVGDVRTSGVPERHGFDDFFGYYHQVHAHFFYPRFLWRSGKKIPLPGNARSLIDARDLKSFRADKLYRGTQFSHHLIVEESKKFIRANKDRPFFCYLPWTPPHGPYPEGIDDPAIDDFEDRPWSHDDKIYAGMVRMIDRQVGEILSLLEESGIDEKTIVFFCADNGGTRLRHRTFNSNRHLRGQKGELYEGGLRIPLLVRWPTHVKPGSRSDLLCYFPDIMPTLAALAGATSHLPSDIDGISIVPTLLGKPEQQRKHDFLYWEYPRGNFVEKTFSAENVATALRRGNWKLVRPTTSAPWELYDLEDDPSEQNDLATEHRDMVVELAALAKASHVDMPQAEPDMPPNVRFRH
jgi:arylsulfatase A-like enzyme